MKNQDFTSKSPTLYANRKIDLFHRVIVNQAPSGDIVIAEVEREITGNIKDLRDNVVGDTTTNTNQLTASSAASGTSLLFNSFIDVGIH